MNPPSPTLLPSGELAARDDQLLMTPVSQRRAPARRRVSLTLASRATGHLTGGAVALGLGWSGDSPWLGAAVVMIALSAGVMLSGHEAQWRAPPAPVGGADPPLAAAAAADGDAVPPVRAAGVLRPVAGAARRDGRARPHRDGPGRVGGGGDPRVAGGPVAREA